MAAPKLDAKTIAAWTALVLALSGAIELRSKVGDISNRLDRVEHRLDQLVEDRYASSN